MTVWKMPPKAKVYEALSAVADQRITMTGQAAAQVLSSARDKVYNVTWSGDLREIASNDNASYWQGYLGYPIIAVLMKLGKVSFSARIAALLAGVPWKTINRRFKRDYGKAIRHVLDEVEAKGGSRSEIEREVENIYDQLAAMGLQRASRRRPPEQKG